jgi:hypothetical protein
VITTANEALQRSQANHDPLTDYKTYGTIYNPYVKRRKNHPTAAANKTTPSSQSTASAAKSVLGQPPAATRPSKPAAPASSSSAKPAAKAQPAAKSAGGALFNSFAKTRPPAKKAASPPAKKADEDGKQPPPFPVRSAPGGVSPCRKTAKREMGDHPLTIPAQKR